MARDPISQSQRFRILRRDHFTCMYCGNRPPWAVLNVDHYVPVAAGGKTEDGNLITACWPCNSGKSDSVSPKQDERPARYWAATKCTCARPTCRGCHGGRDQLEWNCGCKWCHGCPTCGEFSCPQAKDGLSECWSAGFYVDNGNEEILKTMTPEYAEILRGIRRARLSGNTGESGN